MSWIIKHTVFWYEFDKFVYPVQVIKQFAAVVFNYEGESIYVFRNVETINLMWKKSICYKVVILNRHSATSKDIHLVS